MMILSKPFTVLLLLLFFLFTAPSTSTPITPEIPSPTTNPNKTSCSLYLILKGNCLPQLSSVHFTFSLIYLSFLVYWILLCFKTKPSFRKIHFLMGALILIKALTLIYSADKALSVLRLLIVMYLIGYGWYFLEPIMQEVDKTVLMILILLQVLAYVLRILMMGETETGANIITDDWLNLKVMLVVIDFFSCFAILFPFSCTIFWDFNTNKFEKMIGLRIFYTMVITYLLFLGSGVRLVRENGDVGLNVIDAQKYVLKSNLALELISLNFYMIMFNMFRKQFAAFVDHHD